MVPLSIDILILMVTLPYKEDITMTDWLDELNEDLKTPSEKEEEHRNKIKEKENIIREQIYRDWLSLRERLKDAQKISAIRGKSVTLTEGGSREIVFEYAGKKIVLRCDLENLKIHFQSHDEKAKEIIWNRVQNFYAYSSDHRKMIDPDEELGEMIKNLFK